MIELLEKIESDLEEDNSESDRKESDVLSISFKIEDGELTAKSHMAVQTGDSSREYSYDTVDVQLNNYDTDELKSTIADSNITSVLSPFENVGNPILKYQSDRQYTGDRLKLYIRHQENYDDIPLTDSLIEKLKQAIVEKEQSPINDPSRITSVEVDAPETDQDPPRGLSPDSTILYSTDEPHKMWAGCDTLDDYAEMVAEDSDEYTKQDILDKNNYKSHYHLSGSHAPFEIFRRVAEEIKSVGGIENEMADVSRYKIDSEENTMEAVFHVGEILR